MTRLAIAVAAAAAASACTDPVTGVATMATTGSASAAVATALAVPPSASDPPMVPAAPGIPACPVMVRPVPSRFEITLAGRAAPPKVGLKHDLVGRPLTIARDMIGFAAFGDVTAFDHGGAERWKWRTEKRAGPDGTERWPVYAGDGNGHVVAWWPFSGHVAIRAPDGAVRELDVPAAPTAGLGAPVPLDGRVWLRAGAGAAGPWLGAVDPAAGSFTASATPETSPGLLALAGTGTGELPRVTDAGGCLRAELLGSAGSGGYLVERHDVVSDTVIVRAEALAKEVAGAPGIVRVWVWKLR